MKRYAIAKFHEPALKGKNRPMFIRKLVNNLRRSVKGTDVEEVWQGQMMIGLTMPEDADWPPIKTRIGDCFGVEKFFPARKVGQDLQEVRDILPAEMEGRKFETFRITAHRSDKRFPTTSDQINRELGDFVGTLTGARVNLKYPDLEIFIDVIQGAQPLADDDFSAVYVVRRQECVSRAPRGSHPVPGIANHIGILGILVAYTPNVSDVV